MDMSAISRRILVSLLVLIVVLPLMAYAGIWVFVNTKARDVVTAQARKSLNRDVRIETISFVPPLGIRVRGFAVDDIIAFSELVVIADPVKIMQGVAGIADVRCRDLTAKVVRGRNGSLMAPVPVPLSEQGAASTGTDISKTPASSQTSPLRVRIDSVSMENTVIMYRDEAIPASKPLEVRLVLETLIVDDVTWPAVGRTDFRTAGGLIIDGRTLPRSVSGAGWVDLRKKDMDADVQLTGLPLEMINPYLPDWLTMQAAGIRSADLTFSASATAAADALTVTVNAGIPACEYIKTQDYGPLLIRGVIDEFAGGKPYPQMDVTFHTRLSAPALDMGQITEQIEQARAKAEKALVRTAVKTGISEAVEELSRKHPEAVEALGALDSLFRGLLSK